MFRIKRTKTAPAGPDGTLPVTRTHYAVRVAPDGNISSFTEDQGAAGLFDTPVVAQVQAYYCGRASAGTMTAEDTRPVLPKPETKPERRTLPASVPATVQSGRKADK